jgi:hypothetical protein
MRNIDSGLVRACLRCVKLNNILESHRKEDRVAVVLFDL